MKKYLIVFLISMVPLIELRGAIPYAVGFGLPTVPSYIVAEWGKDKRYIGGFCSWCLEKGHKGGQKLMSRGAGGLFIGLLLFVGIPLPGTGAWTGTLAASILDMGFKRSMLAVMLGVLLAGVIMLAASLGVFGAINLFN